MDKFISYITLKDPRGSMALYEKALPETKIVYIMDGPEGSVMHAEMSIAGQTFMASGPWPGMAEPNDGISPVNFMIYVDDCDAAFNHAIANGMTSFMEPENQFWGDRSGQVKDPEGFRWTLAQQVEKLSEEEINKRAKEFAKQMAEQG